jgi:rRNA-processing protein FCF1
MDAHDEAVMFRRYAAWLSTVGTSQEERREFYENGVVVLDTNVLLSLYEFKQATRDDVFRALERLGDRLWLPHQVGLEFVRRRHAVILERNRAIKDSNSDLNRHIAAIKTSTNKASKYVEDLLRKYADDRSAADELKSLVDEKFDELANWLRPKMVECIDSLRDNEVSKMTDISSDTILERDAKLYGNRVAESPGFETIRQRVEMAENFRFPNLIPPGFADSKGNSLSNAGDFLIWEEVVEMALSRTGGNPVRILFVSNDEKEDWYETDRPGPLKSRPWPWLHDELRQRAQADLCIETTVRFFEGVKEFLGADFAAATLKEIDRASQRKSTVTVDNAYATHIPGDLIAEVLACVDLPSVSRLDQRGVSSRDLAILSWWLVGMTAQLGKRTADEAEREVDIDALQRSADSPGAGWVHAGDSPIRYWPGRSSLWVSNWLTDILELMPIDEAQQLRNYAVRQLDV